MRRRSVTFNEIPTTIITHSNQEYDRTPVEKVNLTFKDVMELMSIRMELRVAENPPSLLQFHYIQMAAEKDIVIFEERPKDSKDSSTAEEPKDTKGDQMEAFNEETNEINWDCPCIADLVKPPCGEQFKEAFSCFVYSKEEVRGSDCVEQFKEMQLCFQKHPEVYGQDEEED